MAIFASFYNLDLDLSGINMKNIVMIHKKEVAESVQDFRPISIINLVPKLISKVLANRLRPYLPTLSSVHQSAFVKGRHIAETFIATCEILQHIVTEKETAVFVKIDFSKAFDSVN